MAECKVSTLLLHAVLFSYVAALKGHALIAHQPDFITESSTDTVLLYHCSSIDTVLREDWSSRDTVLL